MNIDGMVLECVVYGLCGYIIYILSGDYSGISWASIALMQPGFVGIPAGQRAVTVPQIGLISSLRAMEKFRRKRLGAAYIVHIYIKEGRFAEKIIEAEYCYSASK